MNELQAEQQLTGFDNSDAITTLQEELRATLLARNDVDRIYLDPSTVISDGLASDGQELVFDASSQDLMDRVLAVYLLDQFGAYAAVRQSARSIAARDGRRAPTRADDLAAIEALLEARKSAASLANDLANSKNQIEGLVAIVKGAIDFNAPILGEELSGEFGVAFAAYDVANAMTNAIMDDYYIVQDYRNGGDPQALARDYAQMNAHVSELKAASVNVLLDPLTAGLLKAVPDGTPGSYTIMGLNLTLTDLNTLLAVAGLQANDDQAASVDELAMHPPSSSTTGLAELDGHVAISNDQGYAAAQTSLDLCCFGSAAAGIEAVADPSGDYSLVVPLGVPSTNYGLMTLSDRDVITGQLLGSERLNLSNINTTSSWIPNPFSASCTDDDVLNPDEDDPDCD
jgi:hypothetical protein